MISHKPKSKKLTLDELVFGALSQLQVLKYDQRSIRRYQTVWRKLIIFSQKSDYKGKLREQLILDFLAHHEIKSELPTYTYIVSDRKSNISKQIAKKATENGCSSIKMQ